MEKQNKGITMEKQNQEQKLTGKAKLLADALAILEKHKAPKELVSDISELLAPKRGGKLNIDEVTIKDDKGRITHIQDSVTGFYFPATEEFLYIDRHEKGIKVGDTYFQRVSKCGDRLKKAHKKAIQVSKDALMKDMLAGNLTADKAKSKLEAIENKAYDFSECLKLEGVLKSKPEPKA